MKIYKDNCLLISKNEPRSLIKAIGRELKIGSGDNANFFKGYLDDIRIFNRVLGPEEISDLYYENECVKEVIVYDTVTVYNYITSKDLFDSLILYMPFSGNANDKSGFGHNGIVNGALLTDDRYGFKNRSYYFDGINDYIIIENFGDAIQSQEITVSMWVKNLTSKAQFQLMLCPDDNRFAISANYYHAGMNTTFWDFGWQGEGGDAPGRLYFRPEPVDTLWHHYVFLSSIAENTMKIYKDNSLLIDKNEPKELLNTSGRDLKIGSGDNASFFKGYLDDIRIYNRVLNPEEISALYFENICLEQVIIYDTVTVYKNIAVTDTLIIDFIQTTLENTENNILIKVYPNPTNNILYINTGDYDAISNYQLQIINSSSQLIYETYIDQEEIQVDLNSFGSKGIFYIQVLDSNSEIIEIKKVILR